MHNGPDTLLSTVKFLKKPELVLLEKPFKISFLNGKVKHELTIFLWIVKNVTSCYFQITGFDADASDAEWSINIKKGLATKLQMDVVAGEIGKGDTAFLRTVEVNKISAIKMTRSAINNEFDYAKN